MVYFPALSFSVSVSTSIIVLAQSRAVWHLLAHRAFPPERIKSQTLSLAQPHPDDEQLSLPTLQSWDCSHRRSLGISHTLRTTSLCASAQGVPSDASPSILNRFNCVSPLPPQPSLTFSPHPHPEFFSLCSCSHWMVIVCVFLQKRGFSEILTTKRGSEMAGDRGAFIAGHSTTLPSRPRGMPSTSLHPLPTRTAVPAYCKAPSSASVSWLCS